MTATECTLRAGELEARFRPGQGMLGTSLRFRGEEFLRRLENLDEAASKGSTAGIPLLYPWANRLARASYRAAGREVAFDATSPLLHCDDHGLPIHGVKWGMLHWNAMEAQADRLVGRLDWSARELLGVFPFRHAVEMKVEASGNGLLIETKIQAGDAVPVSFGFHPYFGIAGWPRAQWRLELPAMRRLVVDEQGIPNGREEAFEGFDGALGEMEFDAGFRVLEAQPRFVLSGAGRRIIVDFLENYRCAQVFAPKSKEFVALEPMTAPTNALVSGEGLEVARPGGEFRSAFRITVE